ncbi:MAG: ATP-binding protein [Myxococcota bacterium]
MDLRTQTSLIAAVLSLAVGASVLIRPRRRKVHWLFGLFAASLAAWYLTTFLEGLVQGTLVARLGLVSAVALPLAGVQFFRAFIDPDDRRMLVLNRVGLGAATLFLAAVFTPFYAHIAVRTVVFIYVLVMLMAVLVMVWSRGKAVGSRFEAARLRYLALVGALATTFTLLDYLPYVGLDIPPVGTVLILVFLYVLSQSILRFRLLDLYELAARLTILTALSFALAVIFWLLVEIAGGRFFLHSVVAALVVLLLFDPVRNRVEDKIAQFFFRERYDLEQTIIELRTRLAHVLDIDDLVHVLMAGLERSRRLTHASLYLLDDELRGYSLAGHFGPEPAKRIETAPARPLFDRLGRHDVAIVESLERELEERRDLGEDREAETVFEISQTLAAMHASACFAIKGERGEVYGLLCIKDERLRDAFSPEEIQLFKGMAAQAAIAVENSRLYRQMKERDRLAALGEMAAGLAHEIRNPLGAIKASAQFLEEPEENPSQQEFLGIIVEEVDRLNRVVSSFLDYARPNRGEAEPVEINGTVQRTVQLLSNECAEAGVESELLLAEGLPKVRIDPEQLRQVLINLGQNAIQAMAEGGKLSVQTLGRVEHDVLGSQRGWVDIRVTDTGPGISPRVRSTLFVPFVTTKDRGTGLGLAISQRIITAAGGLIEVRSHQGVGTTFVVRLPAVDETKTSDISLRAVTPDARAIAALRQGMGGSAASSATASSATASSATASSATASSATASRSLRSASSSSGSEGGASVNGWRAGASNDGDGSGSAEAEISPGDRPSTLATSR